MSRWMVVVSVKNKLSTDILSFRYVKMSTVELKLKSHTSEFQVTLTFRIIISNWTGVKFSITEQLQNVDTL